ncbi:MAG: MarR family winged helix-turn-helix transcriptional regulator [Anaeroplasmataceae bacterium]
MTYGELIEQSLFKLMLKYRKTFNFKDIRDKYPELSSQEIRILSTIILYNAREENISASVLAKAYGVTTAAIMHKLDTLEDKGYIYRISDELDKRKKYICLSEKMKQEAIELKETNDKNIEHMTKVLGEEDCKNLLRILNKLIDTIGVLE